MECAESCFDPVARLPEDLVAICLSCLDVRALLGVAQHVSHAWKDAIDRGLPALWYDVNLEGLELSDLQLAEVAEKGRDRTRTLRRFNACKVSAQGLDVLRLFSKLQVLQICVSEQHSGPFNALLSSFPLLEDLDVRCKRDADGVFIVFPPLPSLKKVRCDYVRSVQGLANLPSLTKLKVNHGSVEADAPWPASLRKVTISNCSSFNPQVLARIAALQQPTKIATDWSFLPVSFFTPPYDQLSFLSSFTCLDTIKLRLYRYGISPATFFNYLPALTSLRKLHLSTCSGAADSDFQCFPQLTNLQELTLMDIGMTSQGLRHIAAIPNLAKLAISYCNAIKDYSPIGDCPKLRELEISGSCHLSLGDVQAMCRLTQLQELVLDCQFERLMYFMQLCRMRSLRKLVVWSTEGRPENLIPVAAFATPSFGWLPNLSCLEELGLFPIHSVYQGTCVLADCLVQMPKLKRIQLQNHAGLEGRLRAALPRLEKLELASFHDCFGLRDRTSMWS